MAKRCNQAAEILLHRQNRFDAGPMSALFPDVSSLIIRMEYFGREAAAPVMTRTVNFSSSAHAYFHMSCMMRGCQKGGFDLTDIITDMIRNHKRTNKGMLACEGTGKDITPAHVMIHYEISMTYNKRKS